MISLWYGVIEYRRHVMKELHVHILNYTSFSFHTSHKHCLADGHSYLSSHWYEVNVVFLPPLALS
jgi:hypothetical protein